MIELSHLTDRISQHETRIAVMESKLQIFSEQVTLFMDKITIQNSTIMRDLEILKHDKIAEEEKWRIIGKIARSPIVSIILGLAGLSVVLLIMNPETLKSFLQNLG